MSRYDVKSILESSTLPIGGVAKRLKDAANKQQSRDSRHYSRVTIHSHKAALISAQNSPRSSPKQQQRATRPVWCKQEQEQDQDHQDDLNQLQLGNNTYNFFHHPTSALYNLMSLDEHSSVSSNFLVYSGGGDSNGGGGFVMLIVTVIAQEGNNNTAHGFGDNENMFGMMPDPYHGRNLYYLS
ncbi:hypothetical protein LOK49_LG12G00549 [Camellia lanceoleosa]|uniref:Uncharacterized protein n=1 Tax=Camellia lanceoleosa TaxID=1840588 RepID=A0ACC0FR37_9ERIC|nr:hypothetical protein LOK49_LG12G00549 [Camellia lanceoleosa]